MAVNSTQLLASRAAKVLRRQAEADEDAAEQATLEAAIRATEPVPPPPVVIGGLPTAVGAAAARLALFGRPDEVEAVRSSETRLAAVLALGTPAEVQAVMAANPDHPAVQARAAELAAADQKPAGGGLLLAALSAIPFLL